MTSTPPHALQSVYDRDRSGRAPDQLVGNHDDTAMLQLGEQPGLLVTLSVPQTLIHHESSRSWCPESSLLRYEEVFMARTTYWGNAWCLTVEDVNVIRKCLYDSEHGRVDFGVLQPIHPNELASAVFRQHTSFDGRKKYQRPHEIAATLFYGLATNHVYENGNKRTALMAMLVNLDRNERVMCNTTQEEFFEMATSVADHRFPLKRRETRDPDAEVRALGSWIRQRSRTHVKGDRVIEFRKFRKLLEAYGVTFDQPNGNFIKIRLDSHSVLTGYPSEKFDVPISEIKRIRAALGLDGADNSEFYSLPTVVSDLVYEYREVLHRLAHY